MVWEPDKVKEWVEIDSKGIIMRTNARYANKQASTQTLDANEISTLLFMIEEEKMARDVYDALYEQTGLAIFDNISNSEQKHFESLLNTAAKLGVDTSFVSFEAGVFENDEIAALYSSLLEQGSTSATAALEVGALIETVDIADLEEAIAATDIALLGQVYQRLLNGSENHLEHFSI